VALQGERQVHAKEVKRLIKVEHELIGTLAGILAEAHLGETPTSADLEAETGLAKQTTDTLESKYRDISLEKATLEGQLQKEANEASEAQLGLEHAGLASRLTAALERYAVATVATQLMDEPIAVYERQQQPMVLRRAQDIFGRIAGRYPVVVTPLGEFDLRVVDSSSRAKGTSILSRGTQERLYLALRLAYIESVRDASGGLPVLMDEILVNFGRPRRREAAQAVTEFAETRQVVFFTCHQSTVDAFAAVDSGVSVLELANL
jgi:uncharacterized protein YhaN